MRNLFAGAATLAIAVAFSAPTMAQTTQGDAVTGVSPQGTPLVASACNETDLARTQSMIGEAPEDLQPALMQRLATARDLGSDEQRQQCAQELARIESIIQARSAAASGTARMSGSSGMSGSSMGSGSSTAGAMGAAGAAGTAGAIGAGSNTEVPAVAATCNETDLAEVSDLIDQAPESQQEALRQRLVAARDLGTDQENLECAQTLAEIRQAVQGGTGSSQ